MAGTHITIACAPRRHYGGAHNNRGAAFHDCCCCASAGERCFHAIPATYVEFTSMRAPRRARRHAFSPTIFLASQFYTSPPPAGPDAFQPAGRLVCQTCAAILPQSYDYRFKKYLRFSECKPNSHAEGSMTIAPYAARPIPRTEEI